MDASQHAQDRGWLEGVLRRIPGFKGYLDKEYRRESDQLVRTSLADRLQRAKRSIDEFTLKLTAAGQLDALGMTETLRTRVDRLINRLRSLPHGYSGFFDYVQKTESTLEKIYEHDVGSLLDVETLATSIEALPLAVDGAKAIADALTNVEAVDLRIRQREDLLKGMTGPA